MSSYDLLCEIKVNDEIPVRKYILLDSGILVYIAEISSPVTSSYMVVGGFSRNFQELARYSAARFE